MSEQTGRPVALHSSATLARSSALMASGTFVSRVLGMVRVLLLVAILGVTDAPVGNAWQTANTLPNTIYILLAGGVLNVVLVPSLTRAMAMHDGGRDFTDRLITLMLTSLLAITVVVTVGAALVTKLYAWSWSGDQLALAVAFAFLCLPQVFFYGLYTLLGQILNSQERFGWYMWAPVANNVVAIAGLLVFWAVYPEARTTGPGDWTGPMIWLLAGTATLGVMVQAAVLLVPVWRSGFRWRPRWGFRGVGLGAASKMAMWMLAVIGVSQAGMWLSTNVLNRAAELDPAAPGKIAYESAFLFYILPHSLIATSLITAMFTQMSRSAQSGDLTALGVQYRHGLRLLGVAMVPISMGMVVLAPAITSVLLFSNRPSETMALALITMAMVIGLAPYAVYILSGRIFHAFQDGATPFRMQVAITTVSTIGILIAATLPPTSTAIGVALAQTAGQLLAAVLGLLWVRRRLGRLPLGDVRTTWVRVITATAVALVPTVGVVLLARTVLDGRPAALLMLAVGAPLYFTVYAVVAHRLGVKELSEVAAPLLRRLGRGPGRAAAAPLPAGPDSLVPADQRQADRGPIRDELQAQDEEVREEALAEQGAVVDPGPPEAFGPSLAEAEPPPRGDAGLAWSATPPTVTSQVSAQATPGPVGELSTSGRNPKEHGVQGIDAGTVLGGRYVLEELLAQRGDTLDYWSARDSTLDRLVAVTVLPSGDGNEQVAHAVLDGARRVAGIDDPRLVRVLDVGEEDGRSWIIEEGLLEAESLASLVIDRPLPAEEARRVVGESAAALESARRRGLHHLYLNPHAVLRTREGNIKVSGVAVAAAIEQTEEIPAVESSIIDTADLVALLYTGLTGRWPGEPMEGLRSARRLADGALPAPSEVVGGVPGDLDALCRMTLGREEDAARGPQTPGDLARQLQPWSAEVVREGSGFRPDAPLAGGGPAAAGALAGAAGASAAATAAHPWTGEASGSDAPGPYAPSTTSASADEPYYRTTPVSAGGPPDDDTGGLERFGAPERPRRGGSGERSGPSRLNTALVLLLIAAVVATGIFLATKAFRGSPESSGTSPSATSPSRTGATKTTDKSATSTSETSTTTSADLEPIAFTSITSYDPEGDQDEHNDLADRAVDGDPDTYWNSHTYLTPGFGGLKSGVGLVGDLGDDQSVSEVELTFPKGDYGVEVYVNDSPTLDGAELVGKSDDAKDTVTLTADEPVKGRYVIVWFTRAWQGPKGEIAYLSEITVK